MFRFLSRVEGICSRLITLYLDTKVNNFGILSTFWYAQK